MPIPYKKPYTQGKRSASGGPRDQQRRQLQEVLISQNQIDLVDSLKAQIKLLKDQPETKPFTDEQIDDEIIKAVKEETVKYRERINELENENSMLKINIQNKEILIEQLKQVKGSMGIIETENEPDRPKIKTSFIDPIEKDFGNVETHIKTKEVAGDGKENMFDKAAKLKKLLGKV
jgi:TolA-binding protein